MPGEAQELQSLVREAASVREEKTPCTTPSPTLAKVRDGRTIARSRYRRSLRNRKIMGACGSAFRPHSRNRRAVPRSIPESSEGCLIQRPEAYKSLAPILFDGDDLEGVRSQRTSPVESTNLSSSMGPETSR